MSKIWIDLENSPHVLFFMPIIQRLRAKGHEVEITARDFAQTLELLDRTKLEYTTIGGRYGKGLLKKVAGTLLRGKALAWHFKRRAIQPVVSAGHGSRGHLIGAFLLGTPSLTTYDYEFVDTRLANRLATRVYVPALIGEEDLRDAGIHRGNLYRYEGLKEELYIRDFQPDPHFCRRMGLDPSRVIVVFRPPSDTAHYHHPRAELLMDALLDRLVSEPNIEVVLLPRFPEQKEQLGRFFAQHGRDILIPEKAVDGLNLIWHSDLVISGGGTMIREAAVLGVPAFTIFQGRKGAVDRYLLQTKRLVFLEDAADIAKILLVKKSLVDFRQKPNRLADFFVEEIEAMIQQSRGKGNP